MIPRGSLWRAQSSNPLLKMATGVPKVRTLCSKWQLERQKYEPFVRNGSWSAQSTNPVPKMPAGASKVPCEVQAICVNLLFALNYASTALLGGLARNGPPLLFFGKRFGDARRMLRKTLRKTLCGAPQAPHSEVKPVLKKRGTWKRHCEMRADLG